jgi:hypothetical protein
MRGLLSLLKPLCFWIVNGCAFLLKEAHKKFSAPLYQQEQGMGNSHREDARAIYKGHVPGHRTSCNKPANSAILHNSDWRQEAAPMPKTPRL